MAMLQTKWPCMVTSLGEGPHASRTRWTQVACLGFEGDLLPFPQTIALPLTVPVVSRGPTTLKSAETGILAETAASSSG